MSPDIILTFEGGYLRPLKSSDVHAGYVSGLNDSEVNRYLDGTKHVTQTQSTVMDFVLNNEQATNSVLFGIWLDGNDCHCGTVRVHGMEFYHKTAHIGVCIFDKSVWGRKVGFKAIKSVTEWIFSTFEIRWVEAGIYAANTASQKAFLAAEYKWVYDVPDKYLLDNRPATVKVFAARRS